MSYLFLQFNAVEVGLLFLWLLAIIAPIVYSIRNETPVSLGITMAVLAGALVQLLAVQLEDGDGLSTGSMLIFG